MPSRISVHTSFLPLAMALAMAFLLPLCWSAHASASILAFEAEVEETAGPERSASAIEAYSMEKAKRLAAEKAGAYLAGLAPARQAGLTEEQGAALAMGAYRAEATLGDADVQGMSRVYRASARLEIDEDQAPGVVAAILSNPALMASCEASRRKRLDLENDLSSLREFDGRSLQEITDRLAAMDAERPPLPATRDERLLARRDVAEAGLAALAAARDPMLAAVRWRDERDKSVAGEEQAFADSVEGVKGVRRQAVAALSVKAAQYRDAWGDLERMSMTQALDEAGRIQDETAYLGQAADQAEADSLLSLRQACDERIALVAAYPPPQPAAKDPFEADAAYAKRTGAYAAQVREADDEAARRKSRFMAREQTELARLGAEAAADRLGLMQPFVDRLKALQAMTYIASGDPESEVKVELGEPEPDRSRFPLYLTLHFWKTWTVYWPYSDPIEAKAFQETRAWISGQSLLQIDRGQDDVPQSKVTGVRVTHPGTGQSKDYILAPVVPLDEVTAQERQAGRGLDAAKAQVLDSAVKGGFSDPVTGMAFVWVPAGSFFMGCGDWAGDCPEEEKPVRKVSLQGFWMGSCEVTQGQWKRIMGTNPSKFAKGDDYPVDSVSWDAAQEFIRRLNKANGNRYALRLPTEAEWEYAARSGGKDQLWSGARPDFFSADKKPDRLAWFAANSGGQTHPVGAKAANGLGLHDMTGNVREWVQDVYAPYAAADAASPSPDLPSDQTYRVTRGGSWYSPATYIRTTCRSQYLQCAGSDYIGFRLVRSQSTD